jgi:hypothetical protein
MEPLKRPGWLTASTLMACLLGGAFAIHLAMGPIFTSIDIVHPTREGAAVWSDYIVDELAVAN